ncbi:MAG: hypothetical protein N2170_01490 [Bacteroidia bacterium]|nr:hypothetical protein [Bacteroidia bacterium]
MEMNLLPLSFWVKSGIWAILLHVSGALAVDYIAWKGGFAYQVMAGQFLLLAGGVWLLIVLIVLLLRMRRFGHIDPLRIILWVVGVAVLSAPLKAAGEWLMEPLLIEAYEAYPDRRAAALKDYLRRQQVEPQRIEEIVQMQLTLYAEYRQKSRDLLWLIGSRIKVLGLLGGIYGFILGLLLRGGGTVGSPVKALRGGSGGNAVSS